MMAPRSLRDMVTEQRFSSGSACTGRADNANVFRASSEKRPPKRSTFIIEALLLFMCVMVVVAVSISVIAFSASRGAASAQKGEAIVMATNIAEQFAADPASLQEVYVQDDYTAQCELALTMDNAGSMYAATIVVSKDNEEIYSLKTAAYVSHTDAGLDQNVESLSADDSNERRVG